MKIEKRVNSIESIVAVNRKIDVSYDIGRTKHKAKVVGLALVNYIDGSQGLELVGVDSNCKVMLLTQGVGNTVEPEQVYKDDNYFLNRELR